MSHCSLTHLAKTKSSHFPLWFIPYVSQCFPRAYVSAVTTGCPAMYESLQSLGDSLEDEPFSRVSIPFCSIPFGLVFLTIRNVEVDLLFGDFAGSLVMRIDAELALVGPVTGVATLVADVC